MRDARLELRLRGPIIVALYVLGFAAPWERYLQGAQEAGTRGPRVWSWLAFRLFSARWMTSQQAFVGVLSAAILFAFLGALLQVWASVSIMPESSVDAGGERRGVVAGGQHRFLRSRLHLGAWLTGVAVSLLMPRSGGLFFILALGGLSVRWMAVEGTALRTQAAEAYRVSQGETGLSPDATRPRSVSEQMRSWLRSIAVEAYPIGVALSLSALGWTYDTVLLTRCVIISFGVSLVLRALAPRQQRSRTR
ncbi:MAG TPA: hypothetical protein VGD59_13750 [Acidisarcina sp.]